MTNDGTGTLSRRRFLVIAAATALFAGGGVRTLLAQPVSKKRIYIAADDHTDYLWTADEETYREAFIETIDHYLQLVEDTATLPAEFQSRWNCDGSFWLWTYEKNKTAAEFELLIASIRGGHLSAPLTALASCYGGTPAEAVLRGMYYAGRIERRHDLRFPLAVAMENQTLPYGLGARGGPGPGLDEPRPLLGTRLDGRRTSGPEPAGRLVTGGNAYPATSYSLLSVSNPNVLLWALKPAEEGVIARLWNVADSQVSCTLTPSRRRATRHACRDKPRHGAGHERRALRALQGPATAVVPPRPGMSA